MPSRTQRLRGILVDVEPLRRDPSFRLLWFGQLVSGTGRQITAVALPYQLYVLTGSTLAVGLLAVVQLVPILVFALGGGAIADAVDRRRLLMVTQLGLMATSVSLVALALVNDPPVVLLYVVAFVSSGLGALDSPARSSAIPRLVARERLTAALALGQLGFQVMSVGGPVVGGLLIASLGLPAAYFADVLTFLVSLGALVRLPPLPPAADARRPSLGSVAEGLRFARGHRVIMSTFVIDLNAMIFGSPVSLFPALALDVFRVGPAGVGLMTAAPAAGAIVGVLLTGWVSRVVRPGRVIAISVAGWGGAILAFGLLTASFPLALVCLAVAGAADVISAVLRNAIVQFETPDALRGRVMSIHTLVVSSGPRLGDAEAAALAALVGPAASVVSGGVLCLLGLAAVVRAYPELLRYRMPVASIPVGAVDAASAGGVAGPQSGE